jgi:hypothetical protein
VLKKQTGINEEWHRKNVMPKNPSLEERTKWRLEHARNCGCRPIPPKLLNDVKKRKTSSAR